MHLDALNPTLIFPHYHAVPGNGHLAAPAARVSLDGEEAQEIRSLQSYVPILCLGTRMSTRSTLYMIVVIVKVWSYFLTMPEPGTGCKSTEANLAPSCFKTRYDCSIQNPKLIPKNTLIFEQPL